VVVRSDAEIGAVRPEFHGHFAEHLGACVYGGLWVGKEIAYSQNRRIQEAGCRVPQGTWCTCVALAGRMLCRRLPTWRDGIGPIEQRPKRVNIHWGGYIEDGTFGTHEFIGLCRLLGAEPYLAATSAAVLLASYAIGIEYCNMPSGSTLAEERIKNGAAEPFRVRYWGVGNENWGCGGWMRPKSTPIFTGNFPRTFGNTAAPSRFSWQRSQWERSPLARGFWTRSTGAFQAVFHALLRGRPRPIHGITPDHMNQQLSIFKRVEDAVVEQRSNP